MPNSGTETIGQILDAKFERGVRIFDQFVWLKQLNPTVSEDVLTQLAVQAVDCEDERLRKMREQRRGQQH